LRADGTVRETASILPLATTGNMPDIGQALDFGYSMSAVPDLDGDGVPDLAVGAVGTPRGGYARGAVWIVLLRRDGTVKAATVISAPDGGDIGPVDNGDQFGSVAWLGDLDGDGISDLAVGSLGDDHPVTNAGSVRILFLNRDGTVRSYRKIEAGASGLSAPSDPYAGFGGRVVALDDLDGDDIPELVVSAARASEGGEAGAAWILFLRRNGTVRVATRLSAFAGGLPDPPEPGDRLGGFLASVDLDGRPPRELVVTYGRDDELRGAYRILFLATPHGR
jgi:hypothetical protein